MVVVPDTTCQSGNQDRFGYDDGVVKLTAKQTSWVMAFVPLCNDSPPSPDACHRIAYGLGYSKRNAGFSRFLRTLVPTWLKRYDTGVRGRTAPPMTAWGASPLHFLTHKSHYWVPLDQSMVHTAPEAKAGFYCFFAYFHSLLSYFLCLETPSLKPVKTVVHVADPGRPVGTKTLLRVAGPTGG